MKTMLLVLIAGLLAMGASTTAAPEAMPDLGWYYDSPCQQPEGVSLHDWLAGLPLHQVEIGGWDCSQSSAYVEWLAQNCGHDAVIACHVTHKSTHCWTVVEGHPYESTGFHWVDQESANTERYNSTVVLENIHAAWQYEDSWSSTKEWAWWLTYPDLRE